MSHGGAAGGSCGHGHGGHHGHHSAAMGHPDQSASWNMATQAEKTDWQKVLARDPRKAIFGAFCVFGLMISLPWLFEKAEDNWIVSQEKKAVAEEKLATSPPPLPQAEDPQAEGSEKGPSRSALGIVLGSTGLISPPGIPVGAPPTANSEEPQADAEVGALPELAGEGGEPAPLAQSSELPPSRLLSPNSKAQIAAVPPGDFGAPRMAGAVEQSQPAQPVQSIVPGVSSHSFVPEGIWSANQASPSAVPDSAAEATSAAVPGQLPPGAPRHVRDAVSQLTAAGVSQMMPMTARGGRLSGAHLFQGVRKDGEGNMQQKARIFTSR